MTPEKRGSIPFDVVLRAASGDKEAFAIIYQHRYEYILQYVRRRVKEKAIAEDITSEVFIKAWRKITDHYVPEPGKNIQAWLATIARNTVIDYYRHRPDRLEVQYEDVPDLSAVPMPSVDSELSILVRDALNELPTRLRRVLLARFYYGMTNDELAHQLGVTKSVASAMCRRALMLLEAPLRSEWVGPPLRKLRSDAERGYRLQKRERKRKAKDEGR